jgi:hypothetical protein
MIQRDPDYRPTIDNILAQSNFWSLDIWQTVNTIN